LPPGSRSLSGRMPRVCSVCTGPPSGLVISVLRMGPRCLWLENFIVRARLVQQVSVSNENGSKIVDGRKCRCKPDAAAHWARFGSRSFGRCLRLLTMRLCSELSEATTSVCWQSVSLVLFVAPPSTRDPGYYRGGRGPPVNSTRHRCLQSGPTSSGPAKPSSSARK